MAKAIKAAQGSYVGYLQDKVLKIWRLLPPAQMKVMPEYVPRAIVNDYEEACAIVEASPKAAAALARRALQGMIRNFWGITRDRLIDEVNALEEKVDPITWKAIDAVRSVGNIGAHMEKDINLIIDVEPDEAQKLIGLIEILVEDWYVARQNRAERLVAITQIGEAKASERKAGKKPTAETEQ
jgi:hypothetical protein